MIAPHDSTAAGSADISATVLGMPPVAASLDQITGELRQLIVKVANLPHVQPESIDPAQPLYRDGLGLDSIDVLELVVNVERNYAYKIRNDDEGRKPSVVAGHDV